MEKPIIATTLSGLFIKNQAWTNAHHIWYKNASDKLKDKSVMKWVEKPDYFKGVDEVMLRLYPNLSENQRTEKARQMFFDSVIENIEKNPRLVNKEVITYFISLKSKFRLALITTNTKQALEKILRTTKLSNLFDIIEASEESEKDDKIAVFERFMIRYGKPVVYIGGDRKDSFDYCKKHNIKHIFVNFEQEKEIPDVETAYNLDELKRKLS